jgi:uncharacterized protein (TIGR02186 family)
MPKRLCAHLLIALAALSVPARAGIPDSIEAGASQNYFYIEPGYNGSSIVLFGSIEREKLHGQAFDIAVTIEGPIKPVTIWKKDRLAGLWVNSESYTFEAVPNYYAVLSTRPSAEIAPLDERQRHSIGLDALPLPLKAKHSFNAEAAAPQEFKDALIRLKRSSGLFAEQHERAIDFIGTRLFRTHAYLPAAAGAGLYRAKFYVLQSGKVVGEAGANIRIKKIGIEARMSAAALYYPWIYGAAAVSLAAFVGSGASLIFRKV